MNDKTPDPEPEVPYDDVLRPHVYDENIREYDKRLPNWWLFTLYGAIVYSFAHWIVVHQLHMTPPDTVALDAKIAEVKKAAATRASELTDDTMWAMSRDAAAVAAGKATFDTTCASCHRPDMLGMIGPNLKDREWVHGNAPLTLVKVVMEGVAAKGMPPWGPVLGDAKVKETVAYILSFHEKGEPAEIKPWVPVLTPPPAPAADPAANTPPAPAPSPAPATPPPASTPPASSPAPATPVERPGA